jgi:threonine/homoserine/homoserine lactone efflux protein
VRFDLAPIEPIGNPTSAFSAFVSLSSDWTINLDRRILWRVIDITIIRFALASFLLTLVPGADTILIATRCALNGRWPATLTMTGVCFGLFAHASLSSLGLSLILMRSAVVFHTVQRAGAIYLIWLGAELFCGKHANALPKRGNYLRKPSDVHQSSMQFFLQGLLTNVLNPKVAFFYFAFLPQFIRPTDSILAKSLLLAAIHFGWGILWYLTLIFLIDRTRSFVRSFESWIRGVSGVALILLGIKLAFE